MTKTCNMRYPEALNDDKNINWTMKDIFILTQCNKSVQQNPLIYCQLVVLYKLMHSLLCCFEIHVWRTLLSFRQLIITVLNRWPADHKRYDRVDVTVTAGPSETHCGVRGGTYEQGLRMSHSQSSTVWYSDMLHTPQQLVSRQWIHLLSSSCLTVSARMLPFQSDESKKLIHATVISNCMKVITSNQFLQCAYRRTLNVNGKGFVWSIHTVKYRTFQTNMIHLKIRNGIPLL
jgi:hypothetical protein